MDNLKPAGRNDGHKFDFSQITDQIYIGSDLCQGGVCRIHGAEFAALGVSFEINLSRENNELPPKEMKVGYLWLPVTDGAAPSQTQLDIGTKSLDAAVKDNQIVFVHCKNGHGRSPTLVVAYLVRFGGQSLDQALALIRQQRPETHIEEVQKKALEEFQNRWST